MKTKIKYTKYHLVALVCFILIVPIVWVLSTRFEGEKPSVTLELPSLSIKVSQELSIQVSDAKSGMRMIWIGLYKDGKEVVLLDKDFQSPEYKGGKIHKETFKIKVEPGKIGVSDGKAILRIVARDLSWRGWWHGNKTYIEKNVTIDTLAPEIDILSRAHNISQGGAALAIYRLSEPCPKSGICVGKDFFPGHSGYFKDPDIFMAFFALSYDQGPKTEIFVKATDRAGNIKRAGIYHYIKKKIFKKDILNISDQFLNWKMPEFDVDVPGDSKTVMLDKFLKVNRDLRKANYRTVTELGGKTDASLYWNGAFIRLPRSANRAGFADQRTYKYKGQTIDHQVHLGVDLASVAHSPIPAANNGKVAFADSLGIYGKTALIDHGFGLYSMYSHLSSFDVQKGQVVAKGEIIGRTGITGLAGGDHLHFGILIHNTFTNPVEWWDATWIKNNITGKINKAKKD
ncbi:MAG: M23 family metallopeptidase [Thermodesulfobacteriota bacterium]|nr:M23 family metallopeptidase [Thermodesulfobacteriota bacterium]